MKRKLVLSVLSFVLLVSAAAAIFIYRSSSSNSEDVNSLRIVTLNEIESLYKSGRNDEAEELLKQLQDEMRGTEISAQNNSQTAVFAALSIAFAVFVLGYVYYSILRPFDKMKKYADEISKGNFDLPLNYERSNYFGSFTWSFDSMRREITKARRCEREAVENNKTVIATLSHDIKTPIASIKAYAEGLEANLDSTPEKRAKYLSVIIRKCDEVSTLTNDLFLHSLADLDKLRMQTETIELAPFLKRAVSEISNDENEIKLVTPDSSIIVTADTNRLMQLCENIINNARKYAGTKIDISLIEENNTALISFRDYGGGIPDEDMPFITDKFYRGHNCGNQQGSGLGLYIVRYICEQLGGEMDIRNHPDGGLLIDIRLPVTK